MIYLSKMKKTIWLLAGAILLSGCQTKIASNKADVLTTIKDAVAKQLVVKCNYTDKDGETTTTYIKGSVVRLVGSGEQANVSGLMKDEKFYLWDVNKKQGMVIDLAKMAAGGNLKIDEQPIKNIDDVVAVLEKNKDKCSLSPESADLMKLPEGINFESGLDWFGGGSGEQK